MRSSNRPERTVVDLSELGLSNVEKLGRYEYSNAHESLPPHQHPDRMEICYLFEGKQIYEVEGEPYSLSGGDVFLTFPDERHGTGAFPEEKGIMYWLILKMPGPNESFINEGANTGHKWRKILESIESRHFRGTPLLRYYLDEVIACCLDKQRELREITVASYLSVFLLEMLASAQHQNKRKVSAGIQKAVDYVNHHLNAPIQLEQLAEIADLSVDWFKEKFRRELGLPPGDFINRRKVEYAKQLLKNEVWSVTEIAYELSFSSSQYFATVFKRYAGQTPTDYREEKTG